jgi:hypothetical protein
MRAVSPRIFSLALLIIIGTGCGQMATSPASAPPSTSANCVPSTHPTFAYVLSYSDATISMYTADSCTGALTATNPATVPTGVDNGFNAESMAMDPTGRFLYVANLGSNATDAATVSMFTINPNTGMLTATSPTQVPTGFFPQGIAASANFVYTANSDDNSVSMFTIDTGSGLLTSLFAFRNGCASAVFVAFFVLQPRFCHRGPLRTVSLCERRGQRLDFDVFDQFRDRRLNRDEPSWRRCRSISLASHVRSFRHICLRSGRGFGQR